MRVAIGSLVALGLLALGCDTYGVQPTVYADYGEAGGLGFGPMAAGAGDPLFRNETFDEWRVGIAVSLVPLERRITLSEIDRWVVAGQPDKSQGPVVVPVAAHESASTASKTIIEGSLEVAEKTSWDTILRVLALLAVLCLVAPLALWMARSLGLLQARNREAR